MFDAGVMRPEHDDFSARTDNEPTQAEPQAPPPPQYALTDESTAESWYDDATHELTRRHQVATPEELLAYIQSSLGFRPTHSLVVVAFSEQQLSTVVRCDLPAALHQILQSDTLESVTFFDFGIIETQELQLMELGKYLGQLMAREPSTTGCLLVYLASDVNVSDHQALAATGTVNALLTAQFALQNILIEESWLIHHDQLWHLRCAATTDCEVQGDALGDPEATVLFQRLDPQGQTRRENQASSRRLIFPPAPSVGAKDCSSSLQEIMEQRPKVVLKWLHRWDDHLSRGPAMLHTDQVVELLAALEHSMIRDTVLSMACFDLNTSIRGMLALDKFPDQLALASGLQSKAQDGVAVSECLFGESERNPNWQRIAALERLCRQLLPLSDQSSGGRVAGLLVWIEWVRGRGSVALDYLRQARKHFPAERTLIMLENVLRQGSVAAWATRTDSAWTPRHAA